MPWREAEGGIAMVQPIKVRTCLWFEKDGLEAARFYVGLIPNSALETDAPHGLQPIVVAFSLAGVPYQILNGGPHFRPTPAASIVVTTRDQPETNQFWHALTANGGEPGRCGWLTDRWGVSWQIVPEALPRLLGAPDRAAAGRAQAAMMQMGKIDIAALEAAFNANCRR
jgi:predicted 3-demethylubiquinone-9 3-methyltransferase (glyoxalase superfamily)